MRASLTLAASLLAFSSVGMAQQPSSTSSGAPTIHTVDVGKGNFMYEPNETYARPGDIITFNFYPTNHSVVRAAYGLPCIPYEETGSNLTGFFSGGFLVDNLIDPPQWNLTINDTQPVFYYCTAIDSCIKQGMVGVINPNASVSLQDQYQQALDSPYMLVPGQPFPNEGEGGGGSSSTTPHLTANPSLTSATPTGDATATAGAASASSAVPTQSSGGSHLSGGAIAGIVIAAVAFIALLAGFFWLLGHRRGSGSATVGPSTSGNHKEDRTEAWAAASSNGPWDGSQAGGPGRGSEMYQKGIWDGQNNQAVFNHGPARDQAASPQPSPGFLHAMGSPLPGTPMHQQHPSMGATYMPQPAEPTELGNNEVTELEAPHSMKH